MVAISDFFQSGIDAVARLLSWIDTNFSSLIYIVFILCVAFFVSKIGTEILSRLLQRTVREDTFPTKADREKRLKTLNSISSALMTFIVWGVTFVMVLNKLGVNTAPLLASAGIVSVALGFGAQSLVKDLVTGVFIIAENQYRVGDYVEIQNVKGIVKSITMRTTVVQDDEGSIFHIPNGSIIVTGNHTMNNSRLGIEIKVPTDADIDKIKTIVNTVGTKLAADAIFEEIITEPIHYKATTDISGGAMVLWLTGRVKAGKQSEVKSAYYFALQKELYKQKIALK